MLSERVSKHRRKDIKPSQRQLVKSPLTREYLKMCMPLGRLELPNGTQQEEHQPCKKRKDLAESVEESPIPMHKSQWPEQPSNSNHWTCFLLVYPEVCATPTINDRRKCFKGPPGIP